MKVAVIVGSESDLPIMEKCFSTLRAYGVPFEVKIMSAHRTPEEAAVYVRNARDNNVGVIIAAAGMAAHLAGAAAANTVLPVIGVPVGASLGGLDALLSTVQMPSGIPVATVAVDGARNAALLAVEILAVSDEKLYSKLVEEREANRRAVLAKSDEISKKYPEVKA